MSEQSVRPQRLLEVKGLKKHYTRKQGLFSRQHTVIKAVDGLDFYVKEGETLGIVGESGCGKSTTGQLILQLLEPTAGEIWFQNQNLTAMNEEEVRRVRRELQIIFQDPYSSLNPRLKVKDIIAEPLRVHRLSTGAETERLVAELLEVVGLGAQHLNKYPHEFSGGQRQRLGIARALAMKPKLIVCDEPVSALDVSVQSQILNLLKKLQQEYQLTYIFIAHGLGSVKYISERIAVMYLGKIVELATRDELFASPRHPYTQALLSAVPIADPRRKKERIILQGDLPNPADLPVGCSFHPRCPLASERCRREAPQFEQVRDGHGVACHYPLNS
ncbi:ABC transporter ATP-binding protein [Paenibacillus senegalimassiliensis]|uniref:ABC transporter ATP-binding protein n=1 Tax=Paenibacillus senegalimassiliensis TaxID=1737426 RepID=UPI00073E1370|nr:ABC transporter ATP-binding protein [Paenibacillus senegalimassiliensis]